MGQLEDVARTKVSSLRFVDEIEVYLGYPVMLKERLHLPINIDDMLYARCSNITARDLDAAARFIKEQLRSEEVLSDFLVKQDKWIEALKVAYPVEVLELENQREEASGRASKAADYQEVERQFTNGLVELSKRAVNFMELSS